MEGLKIASFNHKGDFFSLLANAVTSIFGLGAHDPCIYNPCASEPAMFTSHFLDNAGSSSTADANDDKLVQELDETAKLNTSC